MSPLRPQTRACPSPWVPSIEPEEVPYSFERRALLLSGFSNSSDFAQRLSGRHFGTPTGLEFGIGPLVNQLESLGTIFSRGFLEEHCLSALGLPFCQPAKVKKKQVIVYRERDPAGWRAFGMEAISLNTSHCFCPICAADDIEKRGFSYWRRTPQIVGVRYCPKHRVKTVHSCARCNVPLMVRGLPNCKCPRCGQLVEPDLIDSSDEKALVELRFADAVDGIFKGRITGPMTSTTIRARIAELLPGRPGLPGMHLVDYVSDSVDQEFLQRVGLLVDRHNKFPWPMGLCATGVVFDEALIQLFAYALLSRDKRREEMFRPSFPTSPRWVIASRPQDVIHRVGMRCQAPH